MTIFSKIKKWYCGKRVPSPISGHYGSLDIYDPGHYEQPFLAKTLKYISRFCLKHWQWALMFLFTVALLIVAIMTLINK